MSDAQRNLFSTTPLIMRDLVSVGGCCGQRLCSIRYFLKKTVCNRLRFELMCIFLKDVTLISGEVPLLWSAVSHDDCVWDVERKRGRARRRFLP